MKKVFTLALFALLFGCNTPPAPESVDLDAEKAAIEKVMETIFKAVDDRDADMLGSVFADEGIFMGTDPNELIPKDTLVSTWAQLMQMPEIPPFELITEPFIRIQPDGKTAIYSHQYYWKLFTSIPLRQTFWLVKKDSVWLIDFFDFSFVPYNEQIPALNEAIINAEE
jgi:hypothetical protein